MKVLAKQVSNSILLCTLVKPDFDDIDEIRYCKHCLEQGFQVPLKNRLYPDNQIAIDYENWKQCYECGSIYAINELQKESEIKDIVQTFGNPNDIAKSELWQLMLEKVEERKESEKKKSDMRMSK